MLEKSEKVEKKRIVVQNMDESWKEKKGLYLKYFPISGEMKGLKEYRQKERTGSQNADEEKSCVYCGNIHVRQYNQREIFICEDCRKQFISQRQELFETIIQTQKSLEALLNITFKKTPVLKYKEKWYKEIWNQYWYNYNYEKDKFGFKKEWVEVDKTENEIIFKVYKGLPRTVLMCMTAAYMIDAYIEHANDNMLNMMIGMWKPLNKNTLIKWYGIHYMYLNGYTNFSKWQDRIAASQDQNYEGWCQFFGSPMTNNNFTILDLETELKKKRKRYSGSEKNKDKAKENNILDIIITPQITR